MTHYARRVDHSHSAIVDALRAIGCSVLDLSRVGGGCPDLLVAGGPVGDAVLCEVKSRLNTGGTRGLSKGQRTFMQDWPTRTAVLWDAEDAVCWATGARRPEPPAWTIGKVTRRKRADTGPAAA